MSRKYLVVNRGKKTVVLKTLERLGYINTRSFYFDGKRKCVLYISSDLKLIDGWDYFENNSESQEVTLSDLDDRPKKYYKVHVGYDCNEYICTNPVFNKDKIIFETCFNVEDGYDGVDESWYLADIETIEEITEEEAKKLMVKPVEVKLNDEYTAKIFNDRIDIGCQTFTMKDFDKFVDAVNKVRHNVNTK